MTQDGPTKLVSPKVKKNTALIKSKNINGKT